MLRQARNYIAQSNQALQAGDIERAYNLAVKASLLANELAKVIDRVTRKPCEGAPFNLLSFGCRGRRHLPLLFYCLSLPDWRIASFSPTNTRVVLPALGRKAQ